ncbi:glucose 1-dehydrogenase [Aeromicrobium alkaliterrae]|uniref:Glucose 1-dehydrogenase n=1 Tax=Aeromicrobium alkaliterrae TaxID=302168 RepID=A0ABP4W1V6_9ACTN
MYTDKVVIVTGGSRGLGRAMSLAFAARGAHVVVASRKIEACQEVCDEIIELGGPRPLAVAAHAGSWDDADALVAQTLETFGRLDVLVNNAGSSPPYPSLEELSRELVDKTMALNLVGPLRLTIRGAEAMRETGGGAVLNISSTAAVQPEAYDLPYAIAKAGLHTMTTGLSRALGPTVRVNTIMAGPFDTDVTSAWSQDTWDRVSGQVALGRLGRPEEVAAAALHLCSDEAAFTTGAVLKIDGGMAWSPA